MPDISPTEEGEGCGTSSQNTPQARYGCIQIGYAALYNPVPKGCPLKPKTSLYESQNMKERESQKLNSNSIVISFRLSKSEYLPFESSVERSGGNRSKFFKKLFTENKSKIVFRESKTASEDYKQYLHLVNKMSNNLNQLARLLNGAEKSGRITDRQYLIGLNNLNSIRLLLNAKLGKAPEDDQ